METLGSLLDKYSIAKNRFWVLTEEKNTEKLKAVNQQLQLLQDEIDGYLSMAVHGQIVLEEPKLKMYKHENASGVLFTTLGPAIDKLFDANWTLWKLEDLRRNKALPDAERLSAADAISTNNRIRNDCIDEINRLFVSLVKK
ncbi:MAG TPA: hypothetical protein VKE88_03005 [Candidatus Nanoarchaeia archaeon]|nr:hypothetical protein [Candidatus Nanoarchaeia archaeon]